MNTLTVMLAVWGVVVTAFVALMIYRAQVTQNETDQLFLSDADEVSATHQENNEIIRLDDRMQPIYKAVGGAAALATVLLIGTYIVHALTAANLL
jgi:Tfp pilus assembly protein PilN